MPIAAKLSYLQRRRPPARPAEPGRVPLACDSSAATRRPFSCARHTPGYEVAERSQKELVASIGNLTDPKRNMVFSSTPTTNTSNDRLPDAVQQAKDRLCQRLRSVDLSSVRRQTTPTPDNIWAGPNLTSKQHIFTSEDCRLDSPTISCSASMSTCKVKEIKVDPFSDTMREDATIPQLPEPVSKPEQEIVFQEAVEGGNMESSVDCSICLEGCHSSAGGLIQLRCRHMFHSACLEQWLRSHGDCPYCRASV